MRYFLLCGFSLLAFLESSLCKPQDFTVKVFPRARDCFFVPVEKGDSVQLTYEVLDGGMGDLDIDFSARRSSEPFASVNDRRTMTNDHEISITESGELELCFDNSFSALNPKTIWFEVETVRASAESHSEFSDIDFGHAPEDSLSVTMSLSEIKNTVAEIRENLNKVRNHQEQIRTYEARDRNVAENNYSRVNKWSMWQLILMITVSGVQVVMIRSLFDEKSFLHDLWKRLC